MYERILVPVDDSPASRAAVREAARLAHAAHGTVVLLAVIDHDLVHARHVPGAYRESFAAELEAAARQQLRRLRRACSRLGAGCRSRIIHGRVAPSILRQAEEIGANLIVLGSKQRGKVAALLGGDRTLEVARETRLPLLLVPEPAPRAGRPRQAPGR